MKFSATAIVSLLLIGLSHTVQAEENSTSASSAVQPAAADICEAFADKAAEAKLARHRKELLDVKADIEEQLVVLDEKTKVLEQLISKREQIRNLVSDSLVKMYSNVESEVAAQQLQELNPQMAAEVLQRLNPKQSGEIVTAMEVDFASKVVKTMLADAAKQKPKTETQ